MNDHSANLNKAHEWVKRTGKTVEKALEEYDDACIDFAGDFVDSVGIGRLAYFETPYNYKWRYHAAAEIDGMIHDLWQPTALPLALYMEIIRATSVEYPAEKDDEEYAKPGVGFLP